MLGGTMPGAIFGDHIFTEEAAALGFPLADILFALLGALLASIGWEIVANVRTHLESLGLLAPHYPIYDMDELDRGLDLGGSVGLAAAVSSGM
jgi:hypothetical protein